MKSFLTQGMLFSSCLSAEKSLSAGMAVLAWIEEAPIVGFWFSGSSAHFPFGRLLSASCCSLAAVDWLCGETSGESWFLGTVGPNQLRCWHEDGVFYKDPLLKKPNPWKETSFLSCSPPWFFLGEIVLVVAQTQVTMVETRHNLFFSKRSLKIDRPRLVWWPQSVSTVSTFFFIQPSLMYISLFLKLWQSTYNIYPLNHLKHFSLNYS